MKALYFENDLKKIIALKAASTVSRNAALGRFSPLRYGEIPEPEIPGPRWLKVKNRSCGLCGTDIHFMFMDIDPKSFSAAIPGISRKYLGHELVAEVLQTGDEVAGVRPGDRVALRIDWPSCFQLEIDPPCSQCARGNYMLCTNLGVKQLPIRDTGGGFSPFMVMHQSQPFVIPKDLSEEQALLLEPAASSLHGVMKRKPKAGEKVLVIGAGTIGLITAAAAKALAPEATVTCIAKYEFQATAALKAGADRVFLQKGSLYRQLAEFTGARYVKGAFNNEILLSGFDLIYDTIGNDGSIHHGLRWVKAGGHLVILGINFHPGKIDYSPIWNQEIHVTGINCHATETTGESSFEMAARLLLEKRLPIEHLITHRFAVQDYKKAVKTFLNKADTQAIKIVLDHPR